MPEHLSMVDLRRERTDSPEFDAAEFAAGRAQALMEISMVEKNTPGAARPGAS